VDVDVVVEVEVGLGSKNLGFFVYFALVVIYFQSLQFYVIREHNIITRLCILLIVHWCKAVFVWKAQFLFPIRVCAFMVQL